MIAPDAMARPRTLVVGAVAFIAVAALVVAGATTALDRAVYDVFQRFVGPQLDAVASAATLLGRTDIALALALIVALVFVARRRITALAPLGVFLVLATDGWLKSFIARPRPPAGLAKDLKPLPDLLPKSAETFSFPSSHAALVAFLAVMFSLAFPRLRPVFWIIALLVGLTRLYLDKHWLTDVVGGLLLGLVIAEIARLAVWAIARTLQRARRA